MRTALLAGAMVIANTAGALAESGNSGATARPSFEIQLGGGAEHSQFATIGPMGLTSRDWPPSRVVVNPDLSGWSSVFDGRVFYRPQMSPFWSIDGYRLDFRYRHGTASLNDSFYNPSTSSITIPAVDGVSTTGTAATSVTVNSVVDQDSTDFSAQPSFVWEHHVGVTQLKTHVGASFSSLRQNETIDITGIDTGGVQDFRIVTDGRLRTQAIGLVAGLDARLPISDALAIVGQASGSVEGAHTSYDGQSDQWTGTKPRAPVTATDGRNHAMAALRINGGFELTPAQGLTITILGSFGWQSGVPHVVYPQASYDAFGNPEVVSQQAAHIGLENRASYGASGALRWRF